MRSLSPNVVSKSSSSPCERPIQFSAKNLPDGVILDDKGVLRGVAPKTPGNYDIEVTAANARGCATRTIRLAVGDTISQSVPVRAAM